MPLPAKLRDFFWRGLSDSPTMSPLAHYELREFAFHIRDRDEPGLRLFKLVLGLLDFDDQELLF